MNAPFAAQRLIRFSDTDPAGIVYYPNYFSMFQGMTEDWFTQCLAIDYADFVLRRRLGTPVVHADCDFVRPCRMGETLWLTPRIEKLGRSSIALSVEGAIAGEVRLHGSVVMVTIDLENFLSIPIPADLRERLEAYRAACAAPPAA